MKKITATIDLGSNKIAGLLAEFDKTGRTSILALENLPSRGISFGEITDLEKATEDISNLMSRLQRNKNKRVKDVSIATKSRDVKLEITRGMIPLARSPRLITKKDVKRCMDIAAMMDMPLDRAVIDRMVRGFSIDNGASTIRDPVGLYGMKLEAEAFLVTANRSNIQNITKCVDHAGYMLNGIYLSSTASADSILTAQEKDNGVLLIDIGESLTEVLIYKNFMLRYSKSFQKGATDLLNQVHGVKDEKVDDFFEEITRHLPKKKSDFACAVLTGGGALLDGVIEKAEKHFLTSARMGIVREAGQSLNSQEAIIHASTIGLLDRIASEYKTSHIYKNPIHKTIRRVLDIYESYF